MSGLQMAWLEADDERMAAVHQLRYEALFAPFGLVRDDRWDDAGETRRHLAAVSHGTLVGYACLLLDPDGTGHVRQVSVAPGLQGQGIGRALMAEVEAEARRLGLASLWLNARVTAEAFYARCGWTTVSGRFASGRTSVPHVRMEKTLGR